MKFLLLFAVLFFSCQQIEQVVTVIENPSAKGSAESNIVTGLDGSLYLSWIEEKDDLSKLFISRLKEGKFTWARQIESGKDWFVNWADFPGVAAFSKAGHLFCYWLEMKGEGTYEYDIKYTVSNNFGQSWSHPKVLHNDGVAAEHGFVSAIPYEDKLLVAWLDGREMSTGHSHGGHNHGHGNGSMTLRSALVDMQGNVSSRIMIDDRVCECCQTDMANTTCGPIIVYRDRSPDEIRDTYYAQYRDGLWLQPKPIFQDNWKITGCPVNGPQVDFNNDIIAVAWYTESEGLRKTQLSISTDCGDSFSEPTIISEGEKAMGRIDIKVAESGSIFVSFMEEGEDNAEIKVSELDQKGLLKNTHIVGLNGKSRKSGFPRLALNGDEIYICYPDIIETDKIKVLQII